MLRVRRRRTKSPNEMSAQVDRIIDNGTQAQSAKALNIYRRYMSNMASVEDRRNPNSRFNRDLNARFTRAQYMGLANANG